MNIKGIIVLLTMGMVIAMALACSRGPEASGTAPESNTAEVTGAAAETTPAQPATESGGVRTVSADETAVENRPAVEAGQTPSPMIANLPEPAAIISNGGEAMLQSTSGQQAGILVSGRGEVSAPADVAILRLGVETFAGTVAVARDEASTAMAGVRTVLETRGVPEADIQTKYFRINPRYTSREITRCPGAQGMGTSGSRLSPTATPAPMVPGGGEIGMVVQEGCFTDRERVISGYEVGNNLEVKLRDLDSVGEIIDEVTEAGGDSIRFNGIDFSLDDPSGLESQALTAAIKDAIAKAEDVATAAGVQLGDLAYISESSGGVPGSPFFGSAQFAMQESAVLTRISGGTLEVSASVQALFAIDEN